MEATKNDGPNLFASHWQTLANMNIRNILQTASLTGVYDMGVTQCPELISREHKRAGADNLPEILS